jgi:hypothetical protein
VGRVSGEQLLDPQNEEVSSFVLKKPSDALDIEEVQK